MAIQSKEARRKTYGFWEVKAFSRIEISFVICSGPETPFCMARHDNSDIGLPDWVAAYIL
jgi:hypothetical protein